ncbi:hypothetical protein gpAD87_13095 [Paenibacillus sp. AD87]|nr:hypothetical protein gpAD87_13095 [Paenibacillus sp. AD87]
MQPFVLLRLLSHDKCPFHFCGEMKGAFVWYRIGRMVKSAYVSRIIVGLRAMRQFQQSIDAVHQQVMFPIPAQQQASNF